MIYMDGLIQKRYDSIANALELHLFKPSMTDYGIIEDVH